MLGLPIKLVKTLMNIGKLLFIGSLVWKIVKITILVIVIFIIQQYIEMIFF